MQEKKNRKKYTWESFTARVFGTDFAYWLSPPTGGFFVLGRFCKTVAETRRTSTLNKDHLKQMYYLNLSISHQFIVLTILIVTNNIRMLFSKMQLSFPLIYLIRYYSALNTRIWFPLGFVIIT